MEKNRRRFTRIKIHRPVILETEDERIQTADSVNDLGIGGCLVPVTSIIEEDTVCTIKILLDSHENGRTITIEGTVVRCTDGEAAVKFRAIDPYNLYLLQNLVRYNSSNPEAIDSEINNHPGIV